VAICSNLTSSSFLQVKSIGFTEPIISKGFVDQDVNSFIQRHIDEESCNVIGDHNMIFINGKFADFFSKVKGIVNCVLVYGKCFQFFTRDLASLCNLCYELANGQRLHVPSQKKLTRHGLIPNLYRKYVDDTNFFRNLFTRGALRSSKNSFKRGRAFRDRIGIWKCWFF